MRASQILEFGPFRLDPTEERLRWRGRPVRLRPKALALLRQLAERPGELVTREDLIASVWPDVTVSEATLSDCVREVRRALRDPHDAPRYIETVRGRGYRFVGNAAAPTAAGPRNSEIPFAGREAERGALDLALGRAREGQRQLVFLTGEPGIGKTTLVNAFLDDARSEEGLRIAKGQCLEHFGEGEPYGPVFEAIERLCRDDESDQVVQILQRHGPTWLAHMPSLLSPEEHEAAVLRAAGCGRERMLREFGAVCEALATTGILVLVLEDLHWSDPSTLDLVAALAHREETSRLLVLATVRTAEMRAGVGALGAHVRELLSHRQCLELPLEPLDEATIDVLLALCSGGAQPPGELTEWLARRTSGNPLFLMALIQWLVETDKLELGSGQCRLRADLEALATLVPDGLRQLIEKQIELLSEEERDLIEAASAAGGEFAAASVAAALGRKEIEVEEQCERLARSGTVLRASGLAEWPDGTVSAVYTFVHAFYRDVLYARVSASRRVHYHRAIAERLEIAYGSEAELIAPVLARHYGEGRRPERAVHHHAAALATAARRFADSEAGAHAQAALAFVPRLPADAREPAELAILAAIAPVYLRARSPLDPGAEQNYNRALELCDRLGDSSWLCPVLWGCFECCAKRSQLEKSHALANRLLAEAENRGEDGYVVLGHSALAAALYSLSRFEESLAHARRALELYDVERDAAFAERIGQDIGTLSAFSASDSLFMLGFSDQAWQHVQLAIEYARAAHHPYSEAAAHCSAAVHSVLIGDGDTARSQAEAGIELAREFTFPLVEGIARLVRTLVLPDEPATWTEITESVQQIQSTGEGGTPHNAPGLIALMVEAFDERGLRPLARNLLAAAFEQAEQNRDRNIRPFLHLLASRLAEDDESREREIETALELARSIGARNSELAASLQLARFWCEAGRRDEARALLTPVVATFSEGFEHGDLLEATQLLEELAIS